MEKGGVFNTNKLVIIMVKELDKYSLPDKFQNWAKYQRKTVERIVNSDKKYFVLRAPTGSGKSLMGVVSGMDLDVKTYYIVHNIQLQDQIINDFPFVAQVKGRSNFHCVASMIGETCDPGRNCASGKKCIYKSECEYQVQKEIAMESKFVVFNYAYFLAIINSKYGGFDDPGLVVLDEAHIADSALSGYVNFDMSERQLAISNIRFPTKGEDVFEWLEYLQDESECGIERMKEQLKGDINEEKVGGINQGIKRFKTINYKSTFLIDNVDDDWIIEQYHDGYSEHVRFVPVWVNKFSHLLLGHADKYLLMSATISKLDMELLGIKENEMEFLDMPSTFDPSNMPVIYYGFEKINRHTDRASLTTVIDGLIKRHHNEKGVLHTVSYSLAKYILEHSKHDARMIANSGEQLYTDAMILDKRGEAISEFLESDDPSILVSPSVETGLDLKDDLGRWQIICKVPFASLGDKIVIRRKEDRPIWYTSDAINRIVQGSGRVCRSASDHGITYIIDKNLSWLVKRHQDMFPPWWLNSLRAGNKIKKGDKK